MLVTFDRASELLLLTYGTDAIDLAPKGNIRKEYAGVRALWAMFHVTAQQGSAPHAEENARPLRVPLDAGPAETRFSRVMALFLDEELNPFLSELTADPRFSGEALRQLEEDRADTVHLPSLATASPSREELFTFRVQVAEAVLRRFHARPPGTSRARAEGTETLNYPRCHLLSAGCGIQEGVGGNGASALLRAEQGRTDPGEKPGRAETPRRFPRLTSVPVGAARAGGRPARSAARPCCRLASPTPARTGCGGRGPQGLGSALLYWWPDEGWQLGRLR